ncbi:MAG: FtsW/RodA/SpoVE family cell cycle protein, partial [Acaryochloridaceae cyanobacterium SU_2_1]|nr:FtsW/RodA/SpoVE family cell cycle protein [Acaryochloridaceae cyanobacterium SU_2_1]
MKLRRLISFPPYSTEDWVLEARLLHWLTFFWLIMGLVTLFSASYHLGLVESNDGLHYFKRQLIGVGLGVLTFFVTIHLSLRPLAKTAFLGFFLFLILIFATNIQGLG